MTRKMQIFGILVLEILLLGEDVLHGQEKAPQFSLPLWGTEKRLGLDDFQGQIVVLDFFNAGCVRCFRASWEVETEIKEFYAERSGNPHGIAVNVVSVNSEIADPDDISAFIKENELGLVLDDSEGAVLKLYGGTAVPYLVVIDATGTGTPCVVYRAGFEGIDKLHEVIDAITGQSDPEEVAHGTGISTTLDMISPLPAAETVPLITHESALDISALIASDAFVTDAIAEYKQKRTLMEFSLAVSYRHIEVDYMSEYLGNRREMNLTADRIGVQGSADFDLNQTMRLTFEGGGYDGFQTYRALWLDEYYRHIFDVLSGLIEDLNGYQNARPRGYNMSSGLRWEYLHGTGFADASISYQHDIVSPGYEIGIPIVRLRDTYDTINGHLAFENILTPRMRTLAEFWVTDTTDRNVRYTAQGALNYALTENWVTRLVVAGAKEHPNFTSKSVSALLERDWHSTWFVNLFGRYYEDTSEIANAVVSNAAPPPIKTYQVGLGVRRLGHRSSFKLVAGPCFVRYQRQPERDRAFDQLYKNRNWLSVQIAFLHQF